MQREFRALKGRCKYDFQSLRSFSFAGEIITLFELNLLWKKRKLRMRKLSPATPFLLSAVPHSRERTNLTAASCCWTSQQLCFFSHSAGASALIRQGGSRRIGSFSGRLLTEENAADERIKRIQRNEGGASA